MSSFLYKKQMKRYLAFILSLLIIIPSLAQDIPQRPNPPRLVNDLANVLSAEQKDILEQQLVALDDSTSNQIAIVTVPTLNGNDVADYANKLFRAWGIGNKKNNNGVLILVAIQERKIRIEVGYGLEGAIPDVTAKDIIENDIAPSFKKNDYLRGFSEAIQSLSRAAVGEYKQQREKHDGGGAGKFIFIVILVIIILIVGGRGGGGGGMMSRRGYRGFFPPIWIGGGGGNWGGGGGGGWSGGGGGGGFGGFGGGSSGGGGASGGW